jgi:hypothetical protein
MGAEARFSLQTMAALKTLEAPLDNTTNNTATNEQLQEESSNAAGIISTDSLNEVDDQLKIAEVWINICEEAWIVDCFVI